MEEQRNSYTASSGLKQVLERISFLRRPVDISIFKRPICDETQWAWVEQLILDMKAKREAEEEWRKGANEF